MNDNDWIKELKVGDKVFYTKYGSLAVGTVERLTKTQVIVEGAKYWREAKREWDVGTKVGSLSQPFSWSSSTPRIQKFDQRKLDEQEYDRETRDIKGKLTNIRWHNIDPARIREIHAFLKPEIERKEAT